VHSPIYSVLLHFELLISTTIHIFFSEATTHTQRGIIFFFFSQTITLLSRLSRHNTIMVGQSSPSLMIRLASMLVRERFNTTLFFAPIFYGLTSKGWDMRLTKTSQLISFSFLSLFPCYIFPVTTSTLNIENHRQQEQEQHIWFAVPKSKISRSRKRMKNTSQKRIPLKKNIVFDPRTGEISLRHKLPFNWKDYLPKTD